MRLMPQNKGDEQPINTFKRFRDDIGLWYQEMRAYGNWTKTKLRKLWKTIY